MPGQAATVSPSEITAAPCRTSSGAAAQRAAADSYVTPDARCEVAVGPSSAPCSVDAAAVPSSRPGPDMRQGSSEGEPAFARMLDKMGEQCSSSVRPAVGKTGANLTTRARQLFLRAWRGLLDAHEPCLDAQNAADEHMASLVAAAAERADAARMQSHPLPQMTGKSMREKAAACARYMRANTAAVTMALDSRDAVMTQARGLQDRCASLISAAHAAGLAWLSLGDGSGLAAGQAWCTEFIEVSAGVHGAKVQAHAAVLPYTKAVWNALFDKLAGVKRLLHPFILNSPVLLIGDRDNHHACKVVGYCWGSKRALAVLACLPGQDSCWAGFVLHSRADMLLRETKARMHAQHPSEQLRQSMDLAASRCHCRGDHLRRGGRPCRSRQREGASAGAALLRGTSSL